MHSKIGSLMRDFRNEKGGDERRAHQSARQHQRRDGRQGRNGGAATHAHDPRSRGGGKGRGGGGKKGRGGGGQGRGGGRGRGRGGRQ